MIADTSDRKNRLTKADDRTRFEPWVRARNLESCQLYWMPVRGFPMSTLERRWLLRFYELLIMPIAGKGLEPELFLQMKSISEDHRSLFIQTSRRFHPLFGLGRFPGRAFPPAPDKKYAEDLGKGRLAYDPKSLQPDYAYWFLEKYFLEQVEPVLRRRRHDDTIPKTGRAAQTDTKAETRNDSRPKASRPDGRGTAE